MHFIIHLFLLFSDTMSDDEKKFLVIEFPPTDESEELGSDPVPKVSIIPRNWLCKDTKNKCFWPSKIKDSMAVSKAIAQSATPNEKYEMCTFTKILKKYSK